MSRRFLPLLLLFAATALLGSGCGGDSDSGSNGSDSTSTSKAADLPDGTIGVELGEFFVRPSADSTAAGPVTFQVENVGSTTHEFIIYRTDEKADAIAQDAGIAKLDAAAVIEQTEELQAGDTAEVTVDLAAGSYVLLCNLPGHYASGQAVSFTVT